MISDTRPPGGDGWIEVICGAMFSGKTEELIRRLSEAQARALQVAVFKPTIDIRYHEQDIVSHNRQSRMAGIPVSRSSDILDRSGDAAVIGIDEAQFFDTGIAEVARLLANGGKRVIIAGLDKDFQGEPFGPMPSLLSAAEFVTELHAVCARCGAPAGYSYRKSESGPLVMIGETELYEARCERCFYEARS